MLSKRIIACLDVRDGKVVKGVNFEGLREAGDPASLARRYNVEGIDELVILDVTATIERRRALADTVKKVAAELFIPLTDPALVTRLASRYGSQAVVVAIDAKRNGDRFDVYARSGQAHTAREAVE